MTNQQREALRALAEKATPGPWSKDHEQGGTNSAPLVVNHDIEKRIARCESFITAHHDAAFIAAANPTAILALLDECEELRRENGRLRSSGWRCRTRAGSRRSCA